MSSAPSELAKKTLAIVGGSGYVGQAVARQALEFGLRVICISRRGKPQPSEKPVLLKMLEPMPAPPGQQPQAAPKPVQKDILDNAEWVRGDACDLNDATKNALAESDYTVFTVGTLIDTSVTKGRTPGEPGTYEHMNRDTAITVGTYLNSLNANKKIVYLSASGCPPFLPRYIETKHEAEDFLLSQPNLRATALRPGFIYSSKYRKWSIPLRYEVDLWNKGFGYFYKNWVPDNTLMKRVLKNFEVDRSVALSDVALAAVVTAVNAQYDGARLGNDEIEAVRRTYEVKGSLIF